MRPSISQALTNDTLQSFNRPGLVIKAVLGARVIAELKFRQIAVQMLFAAMLIYATHAALEDRECAFNGVGVDGAVTVIDVLACAVQGGAMLRELFADLAIHRRFVGHQTGFTGDVGANDGVDFICAILVEGERAHGAGVAIYKRENGHLVGLTTARLDNALALAEIGLIDLNRGTIATERGKIARTHRFTDAMGKEPRALVLDFKNAA